MARHRTIGPHVPPTFAVGDRTTLRVASGQRVNDVTVTRVKAHADAGWGKLAWLYTCETRWGDEYQALSTEKKSDGLHEFGDSYEPAY
jgi:hypothetical protein